MSSGSRVALYASKNFFAAARAIYNCRTFVIMIVQLNRERTNSAPMVALPSIVAFSIANCNAPSPSIGCR
jgi:hypothetical protein